MEVANDLTVVQYLPGQKVRRVVNILTRVVIPSPP